LAPRAISAVVLIPIALAAAVFGGPWLAGAAGAAVVIMSYEWARMSAPAAVVRTGLPIFIGAFGAVVAVSWRQPEWAGWWLLGWSCIAAALAPPGVARIEALAGAWYIGAPPAAFLWLRGQDPGGMMAVLALFVIIWCADIAGYFAGRLIGGPKLAPGISPHKTWSGLAGSLSAGAGAGAVCAAVFGGPVDVWMAVGLTLAMLGLCGDLLESALKRRFGVKDASRIIPGHGGMLDRLDGLIVATLGAACVVAAAPWILALLAGGMNG
jgi:phosphatidate cytidylyltransferase